MLNYIQTTYETCLACCLLNEIKELNKENELNCIINSLKFSKKDFASGHLDFIAKKFNQKALRIVDNKYYFDNFIEKNISDLISIKILKINLELIDKLIGKNKIITYLDSFYIQKEVHFPHFVTIIKKLENKYLIYDPWDGKEKLIEDKILNKAIISLRNLLKFCPQIIII